MLFLPYAIDTVVENKPFANWCIVALTVLMFFMQGVMDRETIEALVLRDWSPSGMIGYMFLHGNFMHLFGNMLVLWAFGNTICGNAGNLVYTGLYFFYGIMAAVAHLIFSDSGAIGASGAVNGVVGMAVAMYPLNRVNVFYWIFIRFGTFRVPLWGLALVWFLFDLRGALTNAGGVAYWAHLGGFLAGLCAGALLIERGWVLLSPYDNRPLLSILLRRPKLE